MEIWRWSVRPERAWIDLVDEVDALARVADLVEGVARAHVAGHYAVFYHQRYAVRLRSEHVAEPDVALARASGHYVVAHRRERDCWERVQVERLGRARRTAEQREAHRHVPRAQDGGIARHAAPRRGRRVVEQRGRLAAHMAGSRAERGRRHQQRG